MTESSPSLSDDWLDPGEAARLLGVHVSTLRRWADEGRVPCYRTPGGRRRFRESELRAFLETLQVGPALERPPTTPPWPALAVVPRVGVANEPWVRRFDASQRLIFRQEGRRMMALLIQYATRNNGGEVFLEEGRRLAADYGRMCHQAGFSLVETAYAFVRVRRSIMDSVYEAGALAGAPDAESWRLYDRMNRFLDTMLLATLEAYEQAVESIPRRCDEGLLAL